MRHIEKADIIGKHIVDIYVSCPDKSPDQSYSAGFLRLENDVFIALGAYAPPLVAYDDSCVRDMVRDTKYEKEFKPAIGHKIAAVAYPDETVQGDLTITTDNGFAIALVASCFWVRPCIWSLADERKSNEA